MRINYWNIGFLILALACAVPLNAEQAHQHEAHSEEAHDVGHEDEHKGHGEDEYGGKHEHEGHEGHEEENRVHLNQAQRNAAGIVTEALAMRSIAAEIEAPGEIRLNAYATSRVTPRIEAQVVERHARLGDSVSEGQALATLSSVSMAEAQGALLVAAQEWRRVKAMGEKVVSGRRYQEARIAFQQARAKLLAYGMSASQVERFVDKSDISRANGEFTLLSKQNGTVIRDDFIIGQMLEPGQVLFDITDESKLWIEARVPPETAAQLEIGGVARVMMGRESSSGKIIQLYHALDEKTRTLAVRLEVANPNDHLHPGQFVSVYLQTADAEQSALALPLNAVMRSADGDWQVFVEVEPGEFEAREVQVLRQLVDLAVIAGLEAGTRVVTQGAFFVQSELAKSGFDVHNH